MSPVVTPEEIAEKYAAQRKTLEDLLAEGLAELREMADRRKALVCDVTTGTGGDTELAALERTMATKTTAVDRIRESLPELDRREAIALAAAEQGRKAALRKDLDKQLAVLAKASAAVADLVEALGPAVVAAQLAEDLAANIAGQLDLVLDPFNVGFLLPRSLIEQGVVLQTVGALERQQILSAKHRGDAEFKPTERLRAKRALTPPMRIHDDSVAV